MISRLVCRFRGHVPFFALHSSWSAVSNGYMTSCERCGRVYEEKVRRLP